MGIQVCGIRRRGICLGAEGMASSVPMRSLSGRRVWCERKPVWQYAIYIKSELGNSGQAAAAIWYHIRLGLSLG